jgi:DNA-binding response OmpR family regulator
VDRVPPAENRCVLVVEDDDATRAFLLDNLTADGFRAVGASGAGEGLRAIEVRQPALVILDLLLGDGSGLDLLDRVRAADGLASRTDPELPVIVLTGRAGEADRVRSFARGADDHLSKPFLYAELLARIRALLRRAEGRRRRGVLRVGELTVDPLTRSVRLGGRRVELSAKEFALLHALAEEPERVYGKQELLRDVWGFLSAGNTRRQSTSKSEGPPNGNPRTPRSRGLIRCRDPGVVPWPHGAGATQGSRQVREEAPPAAPRTTRSRRYGTGERGSTT